MKKEILACDLKGLIEKIRFLPHKTYTATGRELNMIVEERVSELIHNLDPILFRIKK